jgi:3-oxoacyl-[acyl-carrier-protein] synthase II
MKAYINGSGNISPQHTWGDIDFASSPVSVIGNSLPAIEPEYEKWINPSQLRRMSRILKMGNAAAAMALQHAGIAKPDGIITGTGYGCIEDTATFLTKITTLNETALNPTPFMQSTHNTIGSQIALLLQCQGYNQTYVHDAFSFEHSLLDALMLLTDSPDNNILVGGVEEVTAVSHAIKSRFGIYRQEQRSSLDLLDGTSNGTIEGEGAAYFVLSGKQNEKSVAVLKGVFTAYDSSDVSGAVVSFLRHHNLNEKDIDLLMTGRNGDSKTDHGNEHLCNALFSETPLAAFKHLSGEHCVASSFATWLAVQILQKQHVPEVARLRGHAQRIENVLIYNPYFNNHHALILLSRCQSI